VKGNHIFSSFNIGFAVVGIGLVASAFFYFRDKIVTELSGPRYEVCIETRSRYDDVVDGVRAGIAAWNDGFVRAGHRRGFRFIEETGAGDCGQPTADRIVIIDDSLGVRYPEPERNIVAQRTGDGKIVFYSERFHSDYGEGTTVEAKNVTIYYVGSELNTKLGMAADFTPTPNDVAQICAASGC
jgi:hypothetical protein